MSIQKRRADLVEAASKPGQCSMSKYVRREVRREPSCSSLADDLAKIIDDSLAEDLSRQELSTAHGLSPGDNGLSESSTAMIVSASPGEKRDEEDLEQEQRAFPGEESEADEEEMEEESEADEESGDEENEEESGERSPTSGNKCGHLGKQQGSSRPRLRLRVWHCSRRRCSGGNICRSPLLTISIGIPCPIL